MENYSITDLNGRVMASGKLNVNEAALNVDALPKGFYFVTIGFSDESSVSRCGEDECHTPGDLGVG